MKATFWASEAGRPIAASKLFGALCRTLQLWRKVPLGAAAALRRRYRRRAEISALNDFELKDIGLHRPDIKA
jgi:uncharacterized protein YjiS (DUF1127 family)